MKKARGVDDDMGQGRGEGSGCNEWDESRGRLGMQNEACL